MNLKVGIRVWDTHQRDISLNWVLGTKSHDSHQEGVTTGLRDRYSFPMPCVSVPVSRLLIHRSWMALQPLRGMLTDRIPFLGDRNQNEGAGPFGILCEGRRRDNMDRHMQSSHSGLEYSPAGAAWWLSL